MSSSFVHGDPVTPVLGTYASDPVRINFAFIAQADGDQDILYYFGGLDDFFGLWGIESGTP